MNDPMDEIKVKPFWLVLSFLGVFLLFVTYMFFWRFLLTI